MLENGFLEFVKPKIEKDIYIFFNSPRKKFFLEKVVRLELCWM